jgi:hypothetical protein
MVPLATFARLAMSSRRDAAKPLAENSISAASMIACRRSAAPTARFDYVFDDLADARDGPGATAELTASACPAAPSA